MPLFSSRSSSKSAQPKFTSYTDPSGEFTTSQLALSLWYVRHKPELYRFAKIGLVIASIALWGYSIWAWGNYIFYTLRRTPDVNRSLAVFPDYSLLAANLAPQAIKIQGVEVFQGGVDKYDVVASLFNPNDRFSVEFDYYFVVEGAQTSRERTFLLPGEERPAASLGIASSNSSFGSPAIRFENVRWQRIDNKKFPSPRRFQEERIQFTTSKVQFSRAEEALGPTAHRVAFDLTNNSAYGYRSLNFYVGLYLQESLVGVMPLNVSNLRSLETRNIDLRSFAPNLNITDVRLFPIINVYDPEVYLKP